VLFKDVLRAAGVPQVDYRAVADADWRADRAAVVRALEPLGLPVFVKPARLGSSVGIGKATSADEIAACLDAAFAHDPLVIAEAMAAGLEVECSVLGNDAPEASEPGEIVVTSGSDWYDYEAKYTTGGMELVVPARIPAEARAEVRRLAVETFRRVDCAGLARVDTFVLEDGSVLINELNTLPGFTSTSVYAKLWEATGLPYPDLLDRLCALGVERFERARAYRY
jgi:D-alanine-D-alanine ligase